MAVSEWDQEDLFNCYRNNDVDYSKELCQSKFPKPSDGAKLLQCYGTKGVNKDSQFCDITYGTESATEPKRDGPKTLALLDCYKSVDFKNKTVCDI